MNKRFKKIREGTGLNKTEFAKRFGIPFRTVQSWELGDRKPPEYVLNLLERVIELESKVFPR